MPSTKELKQRIKGIKSTGKITRAMEMISAVKMRKAVANVVAIRPYAAASLQVLAKVSQAMKDADNNTLFRERLVKKVLCVVVTSHRGLCGSFNTQVMKQVRSEIGKLAERNISAKQIDFVSVGKKGDQMLRRFEGAIKASFPEALIATRAEEVRPVARLVREEYESGRYDKVMLVYTDYVSPMVQKTHTRRLLPLSQGALEDQLSEMNDMHTPVDERTTMAAAKSSGTSSPSAQYAIEPSPETVLQTLIPRLIEMQILHAILESNASQEAARMMAMRNATDAAKDMVADFTLSYNQLRQAKVTQEIAELSAGMAAVSG